MAIVRIDAYDPERFRAMRTAMLAPSTNIDRALIQNEWRIRNQVPLGEAVESITLIGSLAISVGDTVEAYESNVDKIASARVLSIRLIDSAEMTDDELYALGFTGRADYLAGAGAMVMGSCAWWLDIERLDSPPT